jgi:hypothetical protein
MRQSSTQSHISQSPTEGGYQRPAAQHKVNRHHVVGGRMQRTMSAGKNLTKFAKNNPGAPHPPEDSARHHRRSQSGNSLPAPSSPRPGFKRNASSGAIVRAAHQSATGLRKNHSSGHLARQGQVKAKKGDGMTMKRSLTQPSRSRPPSPDEQPAVHFDMAVDDGDDGDDGGWTEESASQSPNTTRSNTRSNSVVAEAQKIVDAHTETNTRANAGTGAGAEAVSEASHTRANTTGAGVEQVSEALQSRRSPSPTQTLEVLPDRSRKPPQTTRAASHHHSRPPDADMITSRLLQRSTSHTVPPQTSAVAATVATSASAAGSHTLLSNSAGSTLVDTPGRDLVSRFMDGHGSAGTPHDGGYMPSRDPSNAGRGDVRRSKRNVSMSNVADAEDTESADTPSKAHSVRSGTTTPTNLPLSRTQNKLLLQRAASNIEPHTSVPAILPRTGGPTFHQFGLTYNAHGEGRVDPRLQQQFNHVAVEYKVVRRYRNPLGDSIQRIQQMAGVPRKTANHAKGGSVSNGHGGGGHGQGGSLSTSTSTSMSEGGAVETDGAGSRRWRVSMDKDGGRERTRRDEGDGQGGQSFEGDEQHDARPRNEAEEMCRRMWESAEVVEAD